MTTFKTESSDVERQWAELGRQMVPEIRMRRGQIEAEPIDVEGTMRLFTRFAELFQLAIAWQKEALADALLRSATVDEDKLVEFEFHAGTDLTHVVQNVKFG